jgi:hypothetical protein
VLFKQWRAHGAGRYERMMRQAELSMRQLPGRPPLALRTASPFLLS